jgi:hypothetical protein
LIGKKNGDKCEITTIFTVSGNNKILESEFVFKTLVKKYMKNLFNDTIHNVINYNYSLNSLYLKYINFEGRYLYKIKEFDLFLKSNQKDLDPILQSIIEGDEETFFKNMKKEDLNNISQNFGPVWTVCFFYNN